MSPGALTSSPIRADRLWAQEREYIVPAGRRIRIAAVRSVKNFSSSESRDDATSLSHDFTSKFDARARPAAFLRTPGTGTRDDKQLDFVSRCPVLNQGDQGENLIPPSLILIPDIPDIPEVPWVPSGA